MTKEEYLAALHDLGLTVASKRTADTIGRGLRQCMRYAAGHAPIPEPVAIILRSLVKG